MFHKCEPRQVFFRCLPYSITIPKYTNCKAKVGKESTSPGLVRVISSSFFSKVSIFAVGYLLCWLSISLFFALSVNYPSFDFLLA